MRRREDKPLQKVTISLFEGQVDRLRELYPNTGASKALRLLIDKHIQEIELKARRSVA